MHRFVHKRALAVHGNVPSCTDVRGRLWVWPAMLLAPAVRS
jgi:hypothetical protein